MSESSLWDHMHKLHKNPRRTRRKGQSLDVFGVPPAATALGTSNGRQGLGPGARHQELTGQDQVEQIHQWIVGQVPLQTVTFLHLTCQLWPHGGDFCGKQRCTKKISYQQKALGTWKMMEDARTREIDRFYMVLSPRCSQIGIQHVYVWVMRLFHMLSPSPRTKEMEASDFFFSTSTDGTQTWRTEEAKEANGVLLDATWVCLKIGYIPNYSHLIGIMIINYWV